MDSGKHRRMDVGIDPKSMIEAGGESIPAIGEKF